ncbi:LuxR C-terminal-related transcriptional regulator [Agromyces sp. GXS1127]|uniref:LuxR C-terminal-related transcriptional regulator n=1 Tax=Agromyces sp. GXS1127 TaxID=3424181 RepID=UPI003D318D17
MVGDTRKAVAPAFELDRVLLDTKLSAPRPPGEYASRQGLIDRARASEARIVGVSAPAGYGKTTFLAEWAETETRPVAWVALDRFDDDPAALLALVATAFGRIFPGAAAVASEMGGMSVGPLGRSAPLLASTLSAAPGPFVILIDDLHEVDSAACQDVLEVALAGIPAGSQVVLAGRHEQAHLARRRAEGLTWEIGAADLRADVAAARVIFGTLGVERTDRELGVLVERSEGWPVGLVLAAMISRDTGDGASIAGDDRFVADYLYRECVRRLPESSRTFLRRTAVLEQMSGALCDAVLERSDSSAVLRELEATGLFLVPLDHRRGWFRYHGLFREFLLAELEHAESGAIPELHRRAADWYLEHGVPARAIEHLLAAGERARSVHLVAELSLPTYQAGQVTVVNRWLTELGEDAVATYPPLAVLAAWEAVLTGRPADAERWADVVERASHGDAPADQQPEFESARAMLRAAMLADGAVRAAEDAELAVASEPAWSPWRDQALHLAGMARLLTGSPDEARTAFAEAVEQATVMGNADSVVLSEPELALLELDAGRRDEAERHSAAALATIDAHHMDGYPTAALAQAVAARLALHRGDAPEAERLLAKAMRARAGCTYVLPYLAVKVRLQLATAYAERGQRTTAMHLLREIDELLAVRPRMGRLVDEVAAFRRRADSAPQAGGGTPLTPAELRLLPYLQTHLTLSEIGRRLFISRNTVSSEVGSIYRKLRVTTRSEAVEQAVALGLLGA